MIARSPQRVLPRVLVSLCGLAIGAVGGAMPWANRYGRDYHTGRYSGFSGFVRWSVDSSHLYWSAMGLTMAVLGLLVLLGGLIAISVLAAIPSLLAAGLGAAWLLLVGGSGLSSLAKSDLRTAGWVAVVAGILAFLGALLMRDRTPTPQ